MTFKEIKQDYPLYLLDRNTLEYSEVKVSSVSVPRFENKVGQMPQTVIDVTVEVAGKPVTYSFPDSLTKSYIGTILVTTDKNDITAELKILRSSSERAIKEVDHHKDVISKCNALLLDLDTTEKEKQATEQRFNGIESSMKDMKDMLKGMMQKLEGL